MVKFLFTDIDGVLNQHNAPNIFHDKALLPECINMLNEVILTTNCELVIISNWAQMMDFNSLTKRLYLHGLIENSIIGMISPEVIEDNHGIISTVSKDKFIVEVLEKFSPDKYAIVDDNLQSSIIDNSKLVSPNTYVGITKVEVDKLIEILNG